MTKKHYLIDNTALQLTTGAGVVNEDLRGRKIYVSFETDEPSDGDWISLPNGIFPKEMSNDGLWVMCPDATDEHPVPVCEWS